jgi:Importin beta binding domain
MSMPQENRYKRPSSKSTASALFEPQRALHRRRDEALQIRKQHKDNSLRRRRGLAVSTMPTESSTTASNDAKQRDLVSASLESYLKLPEHPEPLKLALLSSNRTTIKVVLADLLERDGQAKARALVACLMNNLQTKETRETALRVLLEITSSVTSENKNETSRAMNNASEDDDTAQYSYYGQAALRWSDLFVSREASSSSSSVGSTSLLQILLWLLQQPEPSPDAATGIELICHILGNMVQDSPSTILGLLVNHWALLVSHWPHSAYCCATIVRHDHTHYGMDFLATLTPSHVSRILALHPTNMTAATDAAWILEGLSRREDNAVHALFHSCSDQQFATAPLIHLLLQCMDASSSAASNQGGSNAKEEVQHHVDFLTPALRAVCNIVWACNGAYLDVVLSNEWLIPAINRLLENNLVLIDAIYVASACLVPNRMDGQTAPQGGSIHRHAMSNFIPRLVAIVTSHATRLEYKREAVAALANVMLESDGSEDNEGRYILLALMWPSEASMAYRESLCLSLIALIQVPDTDAVLCALHILNRLLRCIDSSRKVFELVGGVPVLEELCTKNSSEEITQMAIDLFDEFFDNDEDDEAELALAGSHTGIVDSQFSFQSTPLPGSGDGNRFNFAPSPSMVETHSPQSVGRGRGRTMPAWMQHHQQ